MTDNENKLTLAISNYIKNEIREEMPAMLTCALSDEMERIDINEHITEYINENVPRFDDIENISSEILEEKIDREYLDFEAMANKLLKELVAEKMESIEETLMPDLSETLCTLIEESSRVRTAIKKATKEEFKNLLKPVYKNLKSLYFDIFNR